MTNASVIKSLCTAICNTFYPDKSAIDIILFNEGVDGDAEAVAKDVRLLKMAIKLVNGYIESSRTEGGISISVIEDRINANIAIWCKEYGLDADEFVSVKKIEGGSHLW